MTVLATVIVLGVLILVHELGHFIAAKSVGIEVQRFSIGLGPRLFGFRRGETDYVLSVIPLGGYVKMGGMDEMERIEGGPAEGERQPSPRDFDAKPLWARALVISAGVLMNLVFAFLLYTSVAGIWGVPELRSTRVGTVRASVLAPGTESLLQLPSGGTVVEVGGRKVATWGQVTDALQRAPAGPIDVVTQNPAGTVQLQLPADLALRGTMLGEIPAWLDPVVGAVNQDSPAEKGGLQASDTILAVQGAPVRNWDEFVDHIQSHPGERLELKLRRQGGEITRIVTPDAETEKDATGKERTVGKIGIYPDVGDLGHRRVGVGTAISYGASQTVGTVAFILDFLKKLFTGGVSPRSVGSIVTIGQASGQAAAAGLEMFLQFIALFSVNLAVLNLLPIPVLDGGHLLFLAVEGLRGRALSMEQRVRLTNVGFIIVLGIMILALSNDIMRVLHF